MWCGPPPGGSGDNSKPSGAPAPGPADQLRRPCGVGDRDGMPNVFDDDWDAVSERPGFRHRHMRLGRRLGGRIPGASVDELPPGERAFPCHLHHADEELLEVLDGEVALRAPEGERIPRTGDAAPSPRGPEGAHQVVNPASGPARVLMVSTMVEPDVMEYPDTGRWMAGSAHRGRLRAPRGGPWPGRD